MGVVERTLCSFGHPGHQLPLRTLTGQSPERRVSTDPTQGPGLGVRGAGRPGTILRDPVLHALIGFGVHTGCFAHRAE